MIGTKLNDRDTGQPETDLNIFGGTVCRIQAHPVSRGICVSVRIDSTNIAFFGLDTAENFAAALAEGIAKGRALQERFTP
jgi:hypothetical protein